MANALSDRVNEKLGRAMEARGLSSGTPFRAPTDEEMDMMRFEAEQQARESDWEKQYGGKIAGLEQPWIDPIDALAGGITSIPRGLAVAATDVAIDPLIGFGLERALEDSPEAAQAMFIGKRGLKKLAIDPERATVGQFSGLWDKQLRAELEDNFTRFASNKKINEIRNTPGGAQVRNYIDDPESLASAYPGRRPEIGELGERGAVNIPVDMFSGGQKTTGGSYSPARGFSGERIDVTAANKQEAASTLPHELQHAIQEREGFARGGSPQTHMGLLEIENTAIPTLKDRIKTRSAEFQETYDDATYDALRQDRALLQRLEDVAESPHLPENEGTLNEYAYDAYRNLAGEWEARNAGARAVIPTDDPRLGQQIMEGEIAFRGGNPFSTADDIALDDMIVRMDSGGMAKSYKGEHTAPRRDDYHAPAHDLSNIYPDDIYSNKGALYYGHVGQNDPQDVQSIGIIRGMRDNPDKEITIYRAVPKGVTSDINNGDWVTINKKYADEHGYRSLDDNYDVLEKKVKASDIFTDGNSIHEWGYDPE
jgi:hypothetical protein